MSAVWIVLGIAISVVVGLIILARLVEIDNP
jgi:hypothetical protein